MVEDEIHLMTLFIDNIHWLRFVQVNGIAHPHYKYDAPNYQQATNLDREENRNSAMTAASMNLTERISQELMLGDPRRAVLIGTSGTFFLFPIGSGSDWTISFVVNGYPPIDETIKYFEDRDYLANLIPFLDAKL